MINKLFYQCNLLVFCAIFFSACSKQAKPNEPLVDVANLNGIQWILRSDCLTCHGFHDLIGAPPYMEISKKHGGNLAVSDKLGKKIKVGGGGLMYGGVMSPHPFIEEAEMDKIVKWILLLDQNEQEFQSNSPHENMAAILNQKKGFFKLAVINQKNEDSNQIDTAAQQAGFANFINLKADDFEGLPANAQLKFTAEIIIPKGGEYILRLQKSGLGSLNINNEKVISSRPQDLESVLELEKGNHQFEILYTLKGSEDALTFSWITPSSEFFELVR